MPQQNELRVFISSTFRDLQEERDHLMKKIFPEIRSLCRERGITFMEVDLRWGLTHEDKVQGQVLRTCLAEIDRCRPYFIGVTGNRYGYVLEPHELYKDGELLSRYPWVEDAALEGSSMIDMEFRYGALDMEVPKGLFFFRRERGSLEDEEEESEESRKLIGLKQRVRRAGLPIEEFRDPGQLGELVFDALLEIIKTDFAHARTSTPLQLERAKHQAFAASRRVAYIPNLDYIRRLNEFATGDEPPLVIYAESGSGKSSLVSYWAENYRRRNPDACVIEHYVGIGATSTDHLVIMRHIMAEIKEKMGCTAEIPSKPEELEKAFPNFLGFTLDTPFVVIIDGINQLSGHALDLKWLPRQIPKNIRLVITSTVEGTLVQMRERGWGRLGMQPLSENEREAIVVRYLGDFHKSLDSTQISRIAQDIKCAHPLFLRTMLEELRLFGKHDELDRAIDRYLETTGTEDLFQQVLERMEEDYNVRFVRDVMSLLWASRDGLTEVELADLAGVGRLKVSSLTNGLDYHLVRRDEGCLTFFHDYLRRAVEKRYLTDSEKQRERYKELATYYQRQVDEADDSSSANEESTLLPLRLARELVHALEKSGDGVELAKALSTIPVLLVLWNANESEVLELWQRLTERGHDPVPLYKASLDRLRNDSSSILPDALFSTASLHRSRSTYAVSIELLLELLAWAKGENDEIRTMIAHSGLGEVHNFQGDYDLSLSHSTEALRLAESLDDTHRMATALRNLGWVHMLQGRYEEAMARSKETLALAESIGNKLEIAWALNSIGSLHRLYNKIPEARVCFERALLVAESAGDKTGMVNAHLSMSNSYASHGEFAESLRWNARGSALAESIGDRTSMLIMTGNSAISYAELGRFQEALELFRVALNGHREVGFRQGQTHWLTGIAIAVVSLIEQAREYPHYLSEYLPEHTEEDWRAAALQVAREYAEEGMLLSDQLSKPDTLFEGRYVLARIDVVEGKVSIAREKLEELLTEDIDNELRRWCQSLLVRIDMNQGEMGPARTRLEEMLAEETASARLPNLHYMLWKTGEGLPDFLDEQRAIALKLYGAIDPETLSFEDRENIAELRGEGGEG